MMRKFGLARGIFGFRVFFLCLFLVASSALGQVEWGAMDGLDAVLTDMSQRLDLVESGLSARAKSAETVRFIGDVNPEYIDKYLGQKMLGRDAVTLALFFDDLGVYVYGQAYDGQTRLQTHVPDGVRGYFTENSRVLFGTDGAECFRGIAPLSRDPFLFVLCPVNQGKRVGTLVSGVLLDKHYLSGLSSLAQGKVTIEVSGLATAKEVGRGTAIPLSLDSSSRWSGGDGVAFSVLRDPVGVDSLLIRVSERVVPPSYLDLFSWLYPLVIFLFGYAVFLQGRAWRLRRGLETLTAKIGEVAEKPESVHELDKYGGSIGGAIKKVLLLCQSMHDAVVNRGERSLATIETAGEGIITIDTSGVIDTFNVAAAEMFGYQASDTLGCNVSMLMPEPYRSNAGKYLETYLKTKVPHMIGGSREVLGLRQDGEIFPLALTVSEGHMKGGEVFFTAIVRDITHHKDSQDSLKQAATFDALTGLMNRHSFDREFSAALAAAQESGYPLSLCVCDLDKFKGVNDQYGHQAGDEVLIKFGELIQRELREDTIAGRFGGDEFCICFMRAPVEDALIAVERIRMTLSRVVFGLERGNESTFMVGATFGIAGLISKEMTQESLFEAADRALYVAKERGRNQSYVYGS